MLQLTRLSCAHTQYAYGLITRKVRGAEKPKLVERSQGKGEAVCQFAGQKFSSQESELSCATLGGRLHNMTAPGRHIFVVENYKL